MLFLVLLGFAFVGTHVAPWLPVMDMAPTLAFAQSGSAGAPEYDERNVPERLPRIELQTETTTVAKPGGLTLLPVVGPIYSPEFELMITGGVIMNFRTNARDLRLNKSTLMAAVGYSTNGAFFFGGAFTSFWAEDFFRLNTFATIKDMPDNYWGTGFDNGRNVPSGEDTTQYERFWWELKVEPLFRMYRRLYLGANLYWTETRARSTNARMAQDPDFLASGRQNRLFGIGPTLQLDTRDVPDAAWKGFLVKISAAFYDQFLGEEDGDVRYEKLEIDYRHYVPIVKPGWTLAWNLWTRVTFGNTPWHEMPQLGQQSSFRGYFAGQYRDLRAYTAVVEYRHMLHGGKYGGEDAKIRSENVWQFFGNRLGFVAFAGLGGIGRNIEDFENVLPIAGGGIRFLVAGRLHLRADIGVGLDSGGFYLGVNEAF